MKSLTMTYSSIIVCAPYYHLSGATHGRYTAVVSFGLGITRERECGPPLLCFEVHPRSAGPLYMVLIGTLSV